VKGADSQATALVLVEGTAAAQNQGAYHAIDPLAGRTLREVKRLVVMSCCPAQ
jgi:hypothetical protein